MDDESYLKKPGFQLWLIAEVHFRCKDGLSPARVFNFSKKLDIHILVCNALILKYQQLIPVFLKHCADQTKYIYRLNCALGSPF
jgi:hypothetical protein